MKTRVYVSNRFDSHTADVYIFQYGDREQHYLSLGPDGVVTAKTFKETAREGDADGPKPFFSLPGYMSKEVFPALVEALGAKGFDRPSESTLRGENGAMCNHLADLRTLLKLK